MVIPKPKQSTHDTKGNPRQATTRSPFEGKNVCWLGAGER
jgi:hypothetical protein